VLFECPAHEQRIVPVLLVIFFPITWQRDPSLGSCTSGVGAGVGITTGVGATGFTTGFKTGFAAAFTETPLLHTNFVPDFTQVYLIPAEVLVSPCCVHFVPGLTAAVATGVIEPTTRAEAKRRSTFFLMEELWPKELAQIDD
jgi:hypothetical protein